MDDESGESMEPMEQVPLIQLGEAELERLVRGARCYFNVRWKANTSQLSLPHGNRQLKSIKQKKTKT